MFYESCTEMATSDEIICRIFPHICLFLTEASHHTEKAKRLLIQTALLKGFDLY